MKVLEVAQGSVEWMLARAGVVTASNFNQIVDTRFDLRDGKTIETYLNKKLAEWWTGGALAEFSSWDMDQGALLEGEAIPWFEFERGVTVDRVGFLTTDDGRIGASPDGLIGDDGGVEIKCPQPHTHAGHIRGGVVPAEYLAQVHGGMFVSGRAWWNFVSYRRGFPNLVLKVERDDKIQKKLQTALDAFLEKFEAAKQQLISLNGGLPRRFNRTPDFPDMQSQPSFVDDPRITVLN